MNSIFTLAFTLFIAHYADASVCVVSFWSPWGPCIGNCQFGLAVRNRDVMRPPFPERTEDGRLAIRACPPLYQVQTCVPTPCLQGLTDFAGISLTSPDKTAPNDDNTIDQSNVPEGVVTLSPAEPVPIVDNNIEQSIDEAPEHEQGVLELPQDETLKLVPPQLQDEIRGAGGEVTDAPVDENTSGEVIAAEAATEPTVIVGVTEILGGGDREPTIIGNDLVLDESAEQEDKAEELQIENEKSSENATDSSPIINTISIRVNSSSSSSAESNKTGGNSSSSESSAFTDNAAVLSEEQKILGGLSLSDDGGNGRLRQRAVKVPDPDFNKPGIACGNGPDGNRCCRRPMRILCPDGRRPQIVMRYYRNVEQNECTSYSYPYCGYESEQTEQPIKWEEDCYHMCFTDNEKQTMDIFKTISSP